MKTIVFLIIASAFIQLDTAITFDQNNSQPIPQRDVDSAEKAIQAANTLIQQDKPAEALARYKEALSIRPGDPSLVFNAGLAAYLTEDYSTAANLWSRLNSYNPKDLRVWAKLIQPNQVMRVMAEGGAAQTTPCKCQQHPAEAQATGTCSRSEDQSYCTLEFTTNTQEGYEQFVSRLKGMGIGSPLEALRFADEHPPESWNPDDIKTYLPALFAVSQRTRFQERTSSIANAIRESSQSNSQLFGAFTAKGKRVAQQFQIGDFSAVVSYGCVELNQPSFHSMVKTRWSEAGVFCSDFRQR